jgi:hypothetical protein
MGASIMETMNEETMSPRGRVDEGGGFLESWDAEKDEEVHGALEAGLAVTVSL